MSRESMDLKRATYAVSDGVIGAGLLIYLGVVAGGFLDGKLHTSPWLVILLALLGGGLGLARLIKKAMLINQDSQGPNQQLKAIPYNDDSEQGGQNLPVRTSMNQKLDPPNIQPKSAFDFLDRGDS